MFKSIHNSSLSFFLLLCLALLTYLFGWSQQTTAAIFITFFSLNSFVSPRYGINLLVLIFPFCLGNSKRPYFWLIEVCVLIILISSLLHLFLPTIKEKKNQYFQIFLLLILINCLSLPLNGKTLYYFLRGTSFIEVGKAFFSSYENGDVFYLRVLFNHISAIILCVIVIVYYNVKDICKLFQTSFILFAIASVFAFLFRYDIIYHSNPFLTLQLIGQLGITKGKTAMCGFAYNSGYWGQYVVLLIPVSFFILLEIYKKKSLLLIVLLFQIIAIIMIPLTFQRGPLIAACAEILFLIIFFTCKAKNRKKTLLLLSCILFGLLSLIFIVDKSFNNSYFFTRFISATSTVSLRDKIWQVAIKMFTDRPLLGVGTGKFHYFFPKYCSLAEIPWEGHIRFVRSTAHNFYLHLLAEQGIVGFGALICFFLTILLHVRLSWNDLEDRNKLLAVSILTFFIGFFCFGLSQYMFYLRIVEIYFWLNTGFLIKIINEKRQIVNISDKLYLITLIAIASLLFYRIFVLFNYMI